MIVRFFEPPSAQKIGGLNLAIQSLRAFLESSGVTVRAGGTIEEIGNSGTREVIHFHGLWQWSFLKVGAACRRRKIPYVVSPHGMLEPWSWQHKRWKKWPYFHLFEKSLLKGADCLLATSDQEAQNLRRFFSSKRYEVIPIGLTSGRRQNYPKAREELGWRPDELVLLYLSRIHPKKGLDLLLGALAKLGRSSFPERTRLVIVGGGEPSYEEVIRQQIARRKDVLPDIDWVGEVWDERKWLYLQGVDLFCLPSHSENFGVVVLEALQVGTRVLTTNQTPWRSIEEWKAGWVTSPVEAEIENALRQFFQQPGWSEEERGSLSNRIHDVFSWERIGPKYLRLYEELL